MGWCRSDDVPCERLREFDHLLDAGTGACRPVVEHGDTVANPGLALWHPRDVDVDVLNAVCYPARGCIARTSSKDSVHTVLE